MNKLSLESTPNNRSVFLACLLSFSILITPIAAMAGTRQGAEVRGQRSVQEAGRSQERARAVAKTTFANPAPAVPAASPIISASMTDSLENDDGDGKIDPTTGVPATTERIVYSTTITNSGTVDATGVQFIDTIDSHTSLVGGSLNVSPIAGDDSYDTIANTLLEVGPVSSPVATAKVTVTGNVLSNDIDFLGDTFALTKLQAVNFSAGTATATSANGSANNVTMDSAGKFSYTPNANFTGDDTFTYTIADSGGLTSTATVTIHVNAQKVWYVKNDAAGGGNGTSTKPFNTLAAAQGAATGVNDIVYVFNGNNTTSGQNSGFTFQANNQRLIGEGVQLDAPVSVNGGPNPTVLRAAGTAAKIGNSAGDAVTVTNKSGVIIRGFVISDSANGVAVSYTAAGGGVTISNNSIAGGTGNAIDVTTSGAAAGGSATITNNVITAAGVEGIDINAGGAGTLNLAVDTNTITSTGNGFDVSASGGVGSACNVSFTNNTGISATGTNTNGVNIARVSGTLSVTAFSGNQISGATTGNGVVFSGVVFDSNPATGTADALAAGTLTIGALGNGVGLSGLVLVNTTGTLPFTALNIFADGGRGIDALGVSAATAGLTVNSSGTNITAVGGSAVKVDGLTINLQSAVLSSSNSSDNGVAIGLSTAVNGTFSATSGSSISNAAGDDFAVGSGSANITWNAALNNSNGGNAVDVAGHSGGTVSFTGLITDSVLGINLINNTGATISFSGGLSINTGANAAFTATGGGTVTATQNNGSIVNTLQTTTGTALNVANTTIGGSGLTFRSISSNGASRGILLNTTGAGTLTVTGNGGTCTFADTSGCSGGTIQNGTGGDDSSTTPVGTGVVLNSTAAVSLTRMFIHDHTNYGIRGNSVAGFTLQNSVVGGVNGTNVAVGFEDSSISFNNLTGTSTIDSCDIRGGRQRNIRIVNSSGTANDIVISNNIIRDASSSVGGDDNLFIQADTTATVTAHISNNTLKNTLGDQIQTNTLNSATLNIVISSNSWTSNDPAWAATGLLGGLTISGGNGGSTEQVNFNVLNNGTAGTPLTGNIQGGGLNINQGSGGGTWQGQVKGNFVGNGAVANSGSTQSAGIRVENHSVNGTMKALVDSNTVKQWDSGAGINFQVGDTGNASAALDLTVTNNTISNPGTASQHGVVGNFGADTAGTNAVCFDFKTNTVNLGGTPPNGGFDVRPRQRNGSTVRLPGYAGASTDTAAVATFLKGQNTLQDAGSEVAASTQAPGGGFVGGAICAAPTIISWYAPEQNKNQMYAARLDDQLQDHSSGSASFMAFLNMPTDATTTLAGFDQAISVVPNVPGFSQSLIAAAAVTGEDVTVAPQNQTSVRELISRAASSLGRVAERVDSLVTPTAYAETAEVGSQKSEVSSQKSDVRLNHARRSNAGVRNSNAPITASAPFSGETVTFDNGGSGFTLPIGKSVTIVFKVTLNNLPNVINNPYPTGGPQVSNQGRVFGTNFTLVNGVSTASPNTDDPAPPAPLSNGPSDPTVTYADLFNTTTTVQTTGSPSTSGDSVTFTATVAFNPTGSPSGTPGTPTGNVTFKDGATPISCTEGAGSRPLNGSGVATCTTSTLTVATHTINVDYSGDGNFDTSSGSVQQVVDACDSPSIVNKTVDDGSAGTLRYAISHACTAGSVVFQIPNADPGHVGSINTITLNGAELSVARNMTITGPNAAAGNTDPIVISGNNASRVFTINSGKIATISGVTISNGKVTGANNGGGVLNSGTLTLNNVTLSGNATDSTGGGVFNAGNLTVTNSTVSGNTGKNGGGGIEQNDLAAVAVLTNSTVSGNNAPNGGGAGVENSNGTFTIANVTVSGNSSLNTGGGVYNGGSLSLLNSTISGNVSKDDGGGMEDSTPTGSGGASTIVNCTITNNHADNDDSAGGTGGGIKFSGDAIALHNTIVAGNFRGSGTAVADDLQGNTVDTANSTNNLIGTGGSAGLTNNVNGNQVGVADAGLGALQNNGGPTQTHALLNTSTAIEAGTDVTTLNGGIDNVTGTVVVANATSIPAGVGFLIQIDNEQMSVTSKSANTLTVGRAANGSTANAHSNGAAVNPAFDQRGSAFPRKADSADADTTQTVDIGAYEAHPTVEDITDKSTNEDTPFNFNFNIGDGTTAPSLITSVAATSSNPALVPNGNLSVTGSGPTRNLAITPVSNANTPKNGTAVIAVTVTATNGQQATDTFVLTVNAVADTPSVTNASTTVNLQTTSGLVTSANVNDSAETGFFKITNIQNGTLFKNDGTTQINDGDFITLAEGNAGLKFTPANNSTATGNFDVQGSNDNIGTGLSAGKATATITVTKNNSSTAVTSSANPSFVNQNVTFTATVTSATGYTGTPSGSVDFFSDAAPIAGCSARPLNGSGVATCATNALTVGPHMITATYNGDAAFNTSNGSLNTNPQVVNATLSLVVNTTDDTVDANVGNGICADSNGKCSLRAAIQETNFAASDDTITFNIPTSEPGYNAGTGIYTITLGSSLPDITGNLTITGPGPKAVTVTISGNNTFRLLNVAGPGVNLTISSLAFTGGKAGGGQNAAAIEFNDTGTLTVNDSEFYGNSDSGVLAILYSNNSTGINVNRSTFRNNSTFASIWVDTGTVLTVLNSTISNNASQGINNRASVFVTNSTIADNAHGGIVNNGSNGAAATLGNTLLSNNNGESLFKSGTNTFTSNGHNLIDDNTGSLLTAPGAGDLLGTAVVAGLAPLADNGGPTQTRALQSGSAAFDAGDNTLATNAGLTTDQRSTGFNRIVDGPDADATATVDIGAFEAQGSVEDITDKSTNEDTQLQFNFMVSNGISSGNVTAISNNQTIVPNANISVTGASSPLTMTINPAPNQNTFVSGPVTITVTVTSGADSMSDTFLLSVLSVPDVPSVTPATTNEDVQTSSGLVIARNAADGPDVAFFVISNIQNGSLFKNDGTTPIANGGVITDVEGAAGLKFTPNANFFGSGHFDVQGSTASNGSNAGPATTANITINPVADTPSITATTTNEDTQSTTGLVISRNAADGAEVTHFKITGITGGTLFQNNGTTQINNGDFITFAQGNAGLKFTPAADAYTPANTFGFSIQASTSNVDAGLGGSTVPASITVNPIADTPSVTNSSTNEDAQTTTGLVVSRNAADGNEVGFFKITNITNGTLFKNDGTTPISNNQFITFAEGNAGLKFTPNANFFGTGSFQVFASVDNAGTGLSAGFATAQITVTAVADLPTITPATTNEDTQSTSGLVITRNAADGGEVTFFKITGISNGTLFLNNGTTQINNGDFITAAQGGAGLKFTPAANLFSPGSTFTFSAAGATDNVGGGLGTAAAASITVNAVADSPSVTPNPASTAISTQTGSIVINRNAADGAEVTNFKITNITNGTLFQNDGTTPINNNDFITSAQGNAGVKFTPTAGLGSPANNFGFDVQASLNNTNGGLGPDPAVHENILVNCSDPQVVTSILDDGSAGTLRYAISNSCPGTGTITFNLPAGPQTITLGSSLTVTKTLSIIGPSNQAVTISGGGNRVLNVTGGSPSISNLTFTGALVSGGNGGGLLNTGTGTIALTGMTFSGNSADNGGAIATTAGTIAISNSTISGNTSATDGGGIFNNGGTISLLNDTITNNTGTAGQGGGLRNVAGTVNVRNTIIAGNNAPSNANVAGTITDQGNNILSGNPQLAPLANNGGPTMTHALLSNSPALDAGDNAAAAALATDQRGNTFGRVRDAANDADTTATVDIGAFEADPSIEDIQDKTTSEDTALPTFSFRVADSSSAFDSITGASNNQTLVPDANIIISGSGDSRNMDITPAANQFGNATITVTVTKTVSGAQVSMSDTFVLTVGPVGDTPNVTNATTNEDTQSTSGLVISRNAADGAEIANFKITNITGGALFKDNGVTPINNGDFITVAEGNAGLKFTPAANLNSAAGDTFSFQVQSSRDAIGTGLSAGSATAVITVNAVNDAPTFALGASPIVNEDSGPQSIPSMAVNISAGPANESGQTLAFTVTNNNNSLFSAQPAISPAGTLTFTSAPDANGSAIVSVTLKDNGGTVNGGQDTSTTQTFTITVNAVNDAPVNAVPGAQTVTENGTLTFSTGNGNPISIADVDAGGGAMRETLTATNGVITLSTIGGLSFTVGSGANNPTMTFTGTIASINAALQGMTFAPTNGFSGAATLTIVTNDQGNTGSGGALSDTDVVNINVNDGGTLQFSAATYTVVENAGPAVITITRTGASAGTATVKIDTSNGTATSGSDYTAVSQTVTFNDGETSKTVNIPITDDLLNEPAETVNITLSNAGGSGALGTPATAVLTITDDDPVGGYIKFSAPNYNVNEGDVATITVQRVGTLTQAVTVDYATSDDSDPALMILCKPTPGNTVASSRCDFDSAFGRLSWAAGDGADKTFKVMTTQDDYVEGPETLPLTLSNLTGGAAFSGPSTEPLTINDDVVQPPTNPDDISGDFVEQLYRDFLNRPSDPAGKAFWVNNIDHCNDPAQRPPNLTAAQCIQISRIVTAGAFFLSIEFQATGGSSYLTNKVSFGSRPNFMRFERDAQEIGQNYVFGAPGAEAILEANKVAYYNDYVTRTEFLNTYGGLSDQQYVNTLISNTGVPFTQQERDALINGLANHTETRATVLRQISEKPAFRAAEFNNMFVLMEYFGFLRRNPDQAGFDFWLTKLNSFNGDYFAAEMVKAFIESMEDRQRFGNP